MTALAAQLRHARDHVPHYQTSLQGLEITAANAASVLGRLPLLRRSDIRTARARLWSSAGTADGWRTVRTSGTTGTPLEVVLDETAQHAERATLNRLVTDVLGTTARTVFHLVLHASARTRTSVFPDPPATRLVKWNLSRAWALPDATFVRCLQELDGQVVTAMPSVMAALADRVGESAVRPALVVLSGETVTSWVRDVVARTFGCPVVTMYAIAEFGIVGLGCANGYHASEDVVLDIVDDTGTPAAEGEVIVTSLTNRAMPLLRYVTGDRARWDAEPCECGASRRFRLLDTRSVRVVAAAGTPHPLTSLEIAKLTANLDVEKVAVHQDATGSVVVHYQADPPPDTSTLSMVAASVRAALGPATAVRFAEGQPSPGDPQPVAQVRPPSEPHRIAGWVRGVLDGIDGIRAAVLTGSALSPETFTRYSDVDLVVLAEDDRPLWRELAKSMHTHVKGLRANFATAADLVESPLLRARLLSERLPITGDLTRAGVTWPTKDELGAQASFWSQNAKAALWTRATSQETTPDPIQSAYLAAKLAVDALRYHYLLRDLPTTVPATLLAQAEEDELPPLPGIRHTLAIATERTPPPPPGSPDIEAFTFEARAAIDWLLR